MRRRDFLQAGLAASLPVRADPSYLAQSPDMLVTYLTSKLAAQAARWDTIRAQIKSPSQVNERIRFIRDRAREMMVLPQRTPLDPVVVRTTRRQYDEERIRRCLTYCDSPLRRRLSACLSLPRGSAFRLRLSRL